MTTELSRVCTTCPYCGVGCGVEAQVADDRVLRIRGDDQHPANNGRLCVKGTSLADTLGTEQRLLTPRVNGQDADWEHALDAVTTALRQTLSTYGPDAIAVYLSGQLLTEDYYVANKLMKGFVGSAHVDTNSRLCMASAVAAHKRAFGEDVVPCNYSDIDDADLIVLTGSNAAWAHPITFQRIAAAKATRGTRVVVIDPRRTATCELADQHLALRPGSDLLLFNGLLSYLNRENHCDRDYISNHTSGFEAALDAAAVDLETVATGTGLRVTELERFYREWATTEHTLTFFSQGINQSVLGTAQGNAIINCHLATRRIGRAGMGPFSITGQPNAMGGREVGGMANQLAAHMDFTDDAVARVQRFWNAPAMATQPGHKAVDLFDAVHAGKIRFLWILGTNPAVSLPNRSRVREALARCETLVVSDTHRGNDTQAFADIELPALPWGEKDGTVTNSERCLSRQRAFLPPTGDARADWAVISDVAKRLGFAEGFNFERPGDVFREHAALTAFENDGTRVLNLGALSTLSNDEYDQLAPQQWPTTDRPFADGIYSTADGRARFVGTAADKADQTMASPTVDQPRSLVLNTGRLRDQWHTMTRTGLAAKLFNHWPLPTAELHPATAAALGIEDHSVVRMQHAGDSMTAIARLDAGQRRDSVFVPIHWTGAFGTSGLVNAAVPAAVDPVSGQPASKHAQVSVEALPVARWYRLFVFAPLTVETLLTAFEPVPPAFLAMRPARALNRPGVLVDLAVARPATAHHSRTSTDPEQLLVQLSNCTPTARLARLSDRTDTSTRLAALAMEDGTPLWWLSSTAGFADLAEPPLAASADPDIAAWQQLGSAKAASPSVCTCFEVSVEDINRAIEDGARSAAELGRRLRCGTNCGSCVPELNRLLAATGRDEQAPAQS
ncbi:MAG: molybdopterin-dependent oxidoreductase [Pseudomonadota bacterium]